MDKDQRRKLALETVDILDAGLYTAPGTRKQSIALGVKCAASGTRLFGPGPLDRKTIIDVVDATTLQAAHELAHGPHRDRGVGVLNFASGKNPGGGFLRGTQAQEESLARSSALYTALTMPQAADYYKSHRAAKDPRYSDRMIFTPECPVFRDDEGNLLDKPYYVNILTAAAPNRRALAAKGEVDDVALQQIISDRVRKVLHIFEVYDTRTLVLGAWGCGVFGNSPRVVAEAFALALEPASDYEPAGHFSGRFDRICFAIPDKNGDNHKAFRSWFDLDDGKDSVTW